MKLFYFKKSKNFTKEKLSKILPVLSRSEKSRQRKFKNTSDREKYLVSRYMTRIIIAKYKGKNPQDLIFSNNKYGKLILVQKGNKKMDFSLSHSGGSFVFALNLEGGVGVDLEKIRKIDLSRIYDFFPSEDVQYVKNNVDKFFKIWTLREAFIKALGKGFSCSLSDFHFRFGRKGSASLIIKNKKSKNWHFKTYVPEKGYQLALCSSNKDFPRKINLVKI